MRKLYALFILILITMLLTGCSESEFKAEADYFTKNSANDKASFYYVPSNEPELFDEGAKFMFEDLCFSAEDVELEGVYEFTAGSVCCYDVDNAEILYSKNLFERVYPASTTKLLTALIAVKYGNLSDEIVIKEDNCGITAAGASLCGFKAGDILTLEDMLYGLLVSSGNDAGIAIAEYISGNVNEFVKLMNKEAALIGAIDTHFTNPHGLHDINHYSTAYDIYLMFNECLKNDFIKQIFKSSRTSITIRNLDGSSRELEMMHTDLYSHGICEPPEGMHVYGGKTGTTNSAGNCLIIYSENADGHGYITELFKCDTRETLYKEMNELLKLCLN